MLKNLCSCFKIILVATVFSSCGNKKGDDSAITSDTTNAGRSISELTSKISGDSTNADLYFKRSRLYFGKNDLQLSLDDIVKAINLDSSKAEYYMLYADLSFQANKIKNAKAALEKAYTLDPANYDAALRLAELNLYLRQNNASLAYIDSVLSHQPDNEKALLMKGFNYKEKGDTGTAIKIFQKAVENNPDFYDAQMQLGVLMQARDNKLSVNYFNNALRIKPNSEEALYGRALWYQDHNEFNKAIQDYTSILQVNPKNKFAHFNLGYMHQISLKVYDEAIKHYSNAINADPQYAEAYYNRGLCYEFIGNIMMAKEDFLKAAQLKENYKVAEEGLARVSK